jgi:hypothetical protein
LLLGAAACQSEAAPKLHEEPRAAQAPVGNRAGAVDRAPAAQVELARYEAPASAGEARAAAPATAAPASSPGAATANAEKVVGVKHSAAEPTAAGEGTAKPAAGEVIQGAVVTEEPFSVWLQATSPISAGAPAKVEVVLVAKPPYHCNAEYPHKFKLGPAPAGLSYPEATVKGMQVSAERSVLAIPVQAQSAGKATVSGTLSFSVCTEERCLVEKRDLALNLEVK